MSLEEPKVISVEEEDVDETEEEEFLEEFNLEKYNTRKLGKLSEILFELQNLANRKYIEQIRGEMHDGDNGFCLSGGIAWLKGIKKVDLYNAAAVAGIDYKYVFGDHDRIHYCLACPEGERDYNTGIDVQNFLIHLNDDHNITFGMAGTILDKMGL